MGAQQKASHWHAAALAARGAGSGDCPQAPAPHWVSSNAGGPVGGQLQQLGKAGEGTEKGGRSRWQQDLRRLDFSVAAGSPRLPLAAERHAGHFRF